MSLEPEPTGRRGPWRPIAHGISASALQSPGSPEWDEMVQNGTETQFFPGAPNGRTGRGMAVAPHCPRPLCIRTAICRLPGMGRNGTEWYGNSFFPRRPTSKPVRGMAVAPHCPWPLRTRTAICRLTGMGRNGTEWYGNSIFPRRANQQASPGHGLGARLPMASPYPHRNLLAPRNGTKWYRMVRKLNFSPARQPASQSGAWPRNTRSGRS